MRSGLLIDTNLLVLYVVGAVNRDRIKTFKRTSRYSKADYELLVRVIGQFEPLFTVAHVLAEVSNLTDLPGFERSQARSVLKNAIGLLTEPEMPSQRAVDDPLYEALGLVDAAIGAVARASGCKVLTDDLDLYLHLCRDGVEALNFAHLQAASWGSSE
jgi:predicted nucleic acid-binding protein